MTVSERRTVSASRTIAGALVCVFGAAAPGLAQSVADAARQQRERRPQQPCVNRVLTNDDLDRAEILSAKDRACLEAAREAAPAAAAPFSANAAVRPLPSELPPFQPVVPTFHLDSLIFPYESALPDFPLAQIAPYDREMKAARLAREAQLQKTVVVSVPPGRSRLHAAALAPGIAPSIPDLRLQPAPLDAKLPPAPFVPAPGVAPSSAPARFGKVSPVRVVLPDASRNSNLRSEIRASSVRVEPGDSLWKIAARHLGDGRAWRALVALNPQISDPNLIHPGDVLRLPLEAANLKAEMGSTGAAEGAASETRTSGAGSASVRVVLGDTLWALARTQFGRGTAWTCIAQANQLPNPHLILPGQTLTLPASCPATN